MKIVLLSEGNCGESAAGTSVYVRKVTECLARLGHDVVLICPNRFDVFGAKVEFICPSDLDVLPKDRSIGNLALNKWLLYKTPYVVEEFKPDVFHILFGHRSARTFDLINKHVLKIWTVHNEPMQEYVQEWAISNVFQSISFFTRKLISSFINKRRFRNSLSDKIVAVSPLTKKHLICAGVLDSKISVVPNGVDTDFFKPKEFQELSSASIPRLFCLGSYIPRKGHAVFLQAVSKMKKSGFPVYVTFMGRVVDNSYLNYIKGLVAQADLNDFVRFLPQGTQDQVLQLYHEADIYVQPSVSEGFCIPVLEALACGKNVIGASTGAVPELIKEFNGGVILKSIEFTEIKNAIIHLMNKKLPFDEAVSRHRKIKDQYDWMIIAKKLEEIYLSH